MHPIFARVLRQARLRWDADLLLNLIGVVAAVFGGLIAVMIIAQRLFAVVVFNPTINGSLLAAATALLLTLWLIRRPNQMQVALAVDERLRLRERISTVFALQHRDEPFAQAAVNEAIDKAKHIAVAPHFPIRPRKRPWGLGISSWIIVMLIALLLPQYDLLGRLRQQNEQQQLVQKQQQAQTEIRQTTQLVEQSLKQLGDSKLEEDLASLKDAAAAANPEDMKRQAIRKLGDLSDQLKQMQSALRPETMEAMQSMLRQLKPAAEPFSQKFQQELAKGNFQQAADLLRQFQKDIADARLTEEQKKMLAEQLNNLAKQLQDMANRNSEMEKALEQAGLDKQLAKLDPEKLKEALKKSGLTPEQIQQLLQKASACQSACNKAGLLGGALAAAGGAGGAMSVEDLEALAAQLGALDSMQQQMKLSDAALREIYAAMACLGEGMCQGPGGQSPWKEGDSKKRGSGSGGAGQGQGYRDSDADGQTATKSARVQGPSGSGPAVASWYFKGSQIKGEAKRDFSQAVQSGNASAEEAISDNQIPKKYEDSVKKYFGQLEEMGDK